MLTMGEKSVRVIESYREILSNDYVRGNEGLLDPGSFEIRHCYDMTSPLIVTWIPRKIE